MTEECWKPGTRIRIKVAPEFDGQLYAVGWTGTVIDSLCNEGVSSKDAPAVEFDPGFVSFPGGTNEGLGDPRPGCCRWFVEPECIEVIPDGPIDYSKFDEGGVV